MGKFDSNENLLQTVKSMSLDELNSLAEELRKELIEDVSKTGGHLASNLGVVELTIALMKVFNFPEDKIIFEESERATGRTKTSERSRRGILWQKQIAIHVTIMNMTKKTKYIKDL